MPWQPDGSAPSKDQAYFLNKRAYHGINQKRIQVEINFPNLTKARDIHKYQRSDPYQILGWDRRELLEAIVEKYDLDFDPKSRTFRKGKNGQIATENGTWYIYHYYIQRMDCVNIGLIHFSGGESGRSKLFVLEPGNYQISFNWEGTYQRKVNYCFLQMEDTATRNYQSLQTYFVGALNLWQEFYLGTYSGIRHDGVPIVGLGLIRKLPNETSAWDYVADYETPEPIQSYLTSMHTARSGHACILRRLEDLENMF